MLTDTFRAWFLSYLESPAATLLRARARVLFFFFSFIFFFSSLPVAHTRREGRWCDGLQEQRDCYILTPRPFSRACMREYVRACVRALALRAKRRLNARRIGRLQLLRNRRVQHTRRGRESRMGRTRIMEQTREPRVKRSGSQPVVRPLVRGLTDPSADSGAVRSHLENRSGSAGEWIMGRIDR